VILERLGMWFNGREVMDISGKEMKNYVFLQKKMYKHG
jgi:hypothetical protein